MLEYVAPRSLLVAQFGEARMKRQIQGLFVFNMEVPRRTLSVSANLTASSARELLFPTRATAAMIPSANARNTGNR